jgi:hypothetical protein
MIEAEDMRNRGRHGQQYGGYTKEFVQQTLSQMLLARMPLDSVAQKFGVDIRTVHRWRAELNDKYRQDAKQFDPMPFFGRTIEHYEALKAAGWQLYMTSRTGVDKARGLEAARAAEGDMHRFLHVSGFYNAVHFTPPVNTEDSEGARAANDLSEITRALVTDMREITDAEIIGTRDGKPAT